MHRLASLFSKFSQTPKTSFKYRYNAPVGVLVFKSFSAFLTFKT